MENNIVNKLLKIILIIIILVIIAIILSVLYKFSILQKIWETNHIYSTNYCLVNTSENAQTGEPKYISTTYYKDGKFKQINEDNYTYYSYNPEKEAYIIFPDKKEYITLKHFPSEEIVTNIELPTFMPETSRKRFTSFLVGKIVLKTEEYNGEEYYTLSYEPSLETNYDEIKVWVDKQSFMVARKESTNIRGEYQVETYTLKLNETTEEDVRKTELTDYTIKELEES